MHLTSLTDSEIFLRLEEIAREKSVVLRYPHKYFFVSLLRYCELNGELDPEKNLYFVQLTVVEFSKEFDLPKALVQESLKLFCNCGVVERAGKKEFRKVSSNGFVHNQPYFTYVDVSYLNSV